MSGWRCRISTVCTAFCRRWSAAKAATSAMSMWSTGRASTAYRTMDFGIACGSEFSISVGVWWLIRRRKRVPEISEV